MKIKYGNVNTIIIATTPKEKEKLQKLSKRAVIKRKVYQKRANSYSTELIKVLKGDNGKYITLSGLLPYLKLSDYPKVHKDLIDIEKLKQDKIWKILRPYQKDAVLKLLEYPRGIIKASTGAGKTLMMIAICKAIKDDIPVLVIIPKSQLLVKQTYEKFLQFFNKLEIGVNFGGAFLPSRITISSPGCLDKLNLNHYKAVLIDEVQCAASDSIASALAFMHQATIRYGFSATPFGRSDYKDYITAGLVGKIITEIKSKDLIEQGYLAQVKYFFLQYFSNFQLDPKTKKYKDLRNWHWIIKHFILENKTRQKIILELCKEIAKRKDRNCLIIIERKKHGEIIKNLIEEFIGERVELLTSETKNKEKIKEEFIKGKYRFLIGTQLMEVGIDIPNINTLIIGSIGKSGIQLIQRIGRGMRPCGDKKLLVFDLVDYANGVLIAQGNKRKNIIKKENLEFEIIKLYGNIEKELKELWEKECPLT